MYFREYHTPNGRQDGHVDVQVPRIVADRYGMPLVDYDNLSLLFQELELPAEDFAIQFHLGQRLGSRRRPLNKIRRWHHWPFSDTLHVAAWPAHHTTPNNMKSVVDAAVASSLTRHNELRVALERTGYLFLPLGGMTVGAAVGERSLFDDLAAFSIVGGGLAKHYHTIQTQRRTALAQQLYPDHRHDIVFPYGS